jgi:hypothetical protein
MADAVDSPPIAIINEWAAQHWWPGSNPVGRSFAVDTAQRSSDANNIYATFAVRDASRFEEFTATGTDDRSVELHAVLKQWDGKHWAALADAPVLVQFRPAQGADYGTATTVHSGADGTVSATGRDGIAPGTWRLSYAGADLLAPSVSSEQAVAVPPKPTRTPEAEPTAAATAEPTARPTTPPTARPTAHATPTAPVGQRRQEDTVTTNGSATPTSHRRRRR